MTQSKSLVRHRFAYLLGASNQMCCWLRVPKLALTFDVLLCHQSGGMTSSPNGAGSEARQRLIKLLYIIGCVCHIGACIWFYVGANYMVLFSNNIVIIY